MTYSLSGRTTILNSKDLLGIEYLVFLNILCLFSVLLNEPLTNREIRGLF